MRRYIAFLLGVVPAVVLSFASPAWPQGSGSSRIDPPRATRPMTPEEFQQSFWNHLVKADAPYNKWAALSKREVPPRKESPHGVSTTFANKIAADDSKTFPFGSILVREDYDAKGKRTSISVMYRVKGTDPQNGDWYWLRYLENGSVAKAPAAEGGKPFAGRVASCIECHRKADGKDFVFANDAKEPSPPSTDAPAKEGEKK